MEPADGGGVGGASAWCAGGELGGRRLLAALEAGTLLLVALALLLHALRTRAARAARTLRGQRVLITKGDSAVGRELARQFAAEGCAVSVLRAGDAPPPPPPTLHALDVLVVCGARGGAEGLHALAGAVSEEVYSNFRLLEELGGRMRAGGRLVWVSGAAAQEGEGAARGPYAGAARSLRDLARTLLQQVAARSGCRAVWCEAEGEAGEAETAAMAAARVVRRVARDHSLPSSADVFRELGHKVRNAVYHSFARCAKLWT